MKITAVVVTYNRKEYLVRSIEALLGQTDAETDILIVDNASTDGTEKAVAVYRDTGRVLYCNTGENLGGAGGFNYGIRHAWELGYEYYWLMDDDVYPYPDALSEIIKAHYDLNGDYGYLAGEVLWKDGTVCRMNMPHPKNLRADQDKPYKRLHSSTFVSMFLPAWTVEEVGLPIKEFFIWGDDVEYTRRITAQKESYLVPKSKVVHDMDSNVGSNIALDDGRLDRYRYAYRNEMYTAMKEGRRRTLHHRMRILKHETRVVLFSKGEKLEKIRLINSATREGRSFHPEIEYLTPADRAVVVPDECLETTNKISIITPVYKVEKYLRKCIDSILAQTFEDFELIIVDDGSPDSCGSIADEYEQKDSRVHVIHKENGGAPSARNAGISAAIGEYLYFPDSDDWLEPTYLQELYDRAVATNAQLVISGYTMEYFENGRSQSYRVSVEDQDYNTQNQVRRNLHKYFDNMMIAVPWNKLYRRDYILSHNVLFPNVKWDDLHFNMDMIMDIERVAISSSSGYHFFRSRQESETTAVFDSVLYQTRKEQFEHIMKVYDHWGIEDEEILSVIYGYYAARLVQCIQEIAISDIEDKRELIKNILDDELNAKAIKKGKISSRYLSIAARPMRRGNVSGSMFFGKLMGFVKNHMSPLFYRMKSQSVNKAETER